MPTYEYRCKECDHELEVVQAFSDDPFTECPACGGRLRKLFGSVGIAFKGSGFYKNDSRSSTSSTTPSSTADSASTTGGDAGSSSGDAGAATSSTSDSSSKATPAPAKSDAAKPSTKEATSA